MNYVEKVIRSALIEVNKDKLESSIRNDFSCGNEIRKITIIEKQLERFLFLSTNAGHRVKLVSSDYKDITELYKCYNYTEIATIYNVSDNYIKGIIQKLNNK